MSMSSQKLLIYQFELECHFPFVYFPSINTLQLFASCKCFIDDEAAVIMRIHTVHTV